MRRKLANYAQRFQNYARRFSELYANYIQGHLRSFEMTCLSRASVSACQYSIVTMAVSHIISEIKQAIGRKSLFFSHPPFDVPVSWSLSKYSHTVSYAKLE